MHKITVLHWRKLSKIFEREGFTLANKEGDHLVYTKAGVMRPIVIPMYRAIPVFIIRNNITTAGISRERYFELLKEI